LYLDHRLGIPCFHNAETTATEVSNVFVPPALPSVSAHSIQASQSSMPVHAQTSIPHDTNLLPALPNTSMHYQPIMSNPVVSHIPISSLQTNFLPLPRSTLNQIRHIGGPYQGAATADPNQKVTGPDKEPRRAEPNLVPTERETYSQVPPAPNFFPEWQAACSQAPPTSHGVPPSWSTSSQVPPCPNANTRQHGSWYQASPHPNVNTGTQRTGFHAPSLQNGSTGPQG
jgi:hypothetical protein